MIKSALKSAVEEGVAKQRLTDCLGLNINLSGGARGFDDAELNLIMDELLKPLIKDLPEPIN